MIVYLIQSLPEQCPLGYQSSGAALACSPCPPGFACPSSSNPSLNIPCFPGYFSIEGDPFCLSCPAGSACPNTSLADVVACPEGTFSEGASIECSPCPAGWQCPYTDGHGNTPCVLVSPYHVIVHGF